MSRIAQRTEPVMGTVVSMLVVAGEVGDVAVEEAFDRAREVLHHADRMFSLWRPDSPMSRLRRGELELDAVPSEIGEVLDRCRTARRLSGGWFDPWRLPGGLDPTGLVKGWAAARTLAVLRGAGCPAGMVNAAGDIATFGRSAAGRPWRIGVPDPRDRRRLSCVVEVTGSIATSGHYERPGQVVNPHTGTVSTAALSATVVGPDLALADALATGLLAAGPAGLDPLANLAGYEALLVTPDGSARRTAAFPAADAP